MTKTIFPAVALALALVAGPAAAQVVVSGQVLEAGTARAVAGASVRVMPAGRTTQTDAEGWFSVEVPRGHQVLTVRSPGYRAASQMVTAERDVALGPIALTPEPVALPEVQAQGQPRRGQRVKVQGTVVDARTRAPLSAATVELMHKDRGLLTSPEGAFELQRVPAGTYLLRVRMLGYAPVIHAVALQSDTTLAAIALEPDAVMLEALQVTADRFERRHRSYGGSVRVFNRDFLATSTARNVAQLIQDRTSISPSSCHVLAASANSTFGGSGCYRVRGHPTRPVVYIDEVPAFGGMEELIYLRPWDVARVELFGGGRQIRVYTVGFMEAAARRKFLPQPLPL